MAGSAEGWYHLIKNHIRSYSDFCYKFVKTHANKESIAIHKKAVKYQHIDWSNVRSYEHKIANLITKLIRIDPEIPDEELFREVTSMLPRDLKRLLPCKNDHRVEGLMKFLGKQDSIGPTQTTRTQPMERPIRMAESDQHDQIMITTTEVAIETEENIIIIEIDDQTTAIIGERE